MIFASDLCYIYTLINICVRDEKEHSIITHLSLHSPSIEFISLSLPFLHSHSEKILQYITP
uniref:Uncharacterized protein n=1 Tax=Brassica oleracea TaxID=3712 RepID=A0A3P6F6S2_BRAOL|nr:unnamed protein product [Brassica oleracea]